MSKSWLFHFFPNQGGLPIQVDGQNLGRIAASGAESEIDEAIAQAGLDALLEEMSRARISSDCVER